MADKEKNGKDEEKPPPREAEQDKKYVDFDSIPYTGEVLGEH